MRLTEAHRVRDYPLSGDVTLNLSAKARALACNGPVAEIGSNRPVTLELRWKGGRRVIQAGGAPT